MLRYVYIIYKIPQMVLTKVEGGTWNGSADMWNEIILLVFFLIQFM